ncbi:hypothetical protein GCM10022243_01650 [Saccharothrix violaceirubra]|uniref:Uncharacterized protein n=1 Tax=Saccharothrix violaceirubra TaxID=413306 RepID=A0A7W7T4K0_9PSEU|nr:hypothetical protein [Saccharothrix violaceirubra]MBB4965922.1 hypothetical protein [Saccharothrix violaceirubra]
MTILSPGRYPSAPDHDRHPGIDGRTPTARIAAGEEAASGARGFDFVSCRAAAVPDEAERTVRAAVAGHAVRVVMTGAGVRMAVEHTVSFERLVDLVVDPVPGVVFRVTTSPETTVDAVRRAGL